MKSRGRLISGPKYGSSPGCARRRTASAAAAVPLAQPAPALGHRAHRRGACAGADHQQVRPGGRASGTCCRTADHLHRRRPSRGRTGSSSRRRAPACRRDRRSRASPSARRCCSRGRSPSRGLATEYWRATWCGLPCASTPGGKMPIDWPFQHRERRRAEIEHDVPRVAVASLVGDAEVADDRRRDGLALRVKVDVRMRGRPRRDVAPGALPDACASAIGRRAARSIRARRGVAGDASAAATSSGRRQHVPRRTARRARTASPRAPCRQLSIAPVGHGAMQARQALQIAASTT